jgi:hypothetical protein
MAQKAFTFDAHDLYQLLVHYTDGECPIGGEVKQVGVNPYLERMVGLYVESDEWETNEPLQLRYTGKRMASWTKGDEGMDWAQRNDTPNVQS